MIRDPVVLGAALRYAEFRTFGMLETYVCGFESQF